MNGLSLTTTPVKCFSRCFFLVALSLTAVVSWTVTVPEVVIVVELDSVNVTCSTDYTGVGDNDVHFNWTRPSYPHFRHEGVNLFIRSATAAEAGGNYVCTVYSNKRQELIGVGTMRVIVQYAPRWDNTTVMKSAADIGSPGVLTCVVHAEPLPVQFSWTTPKGRSITESVPQDGYSVASLSDNSVLTVQSLHDSDYGVYSCSASNVRGTRSFNVSLQRPGPPDSPQECVQISTSGGNSVTVKCIAGYDGGRPVVYVVYATPSGDVSGPEAIICDVTTAGKINSLETEPLSGNKFKLTVGNLEPMKKYDLLVFARNDLGCSSVAFYFSVQTFAQHSSNVTTGVAATVITLLLVSLFIAVAFNKCRHRLRNQWKFYFSRPLDSDERTRSRQNLISEDRADLVTNG